MKRLHFRNKKLIGIDSGKPIISVDGQTITGVEITVVGADEIIETTVDEEEVKKNFDKVTLSPNKEILIDGKKLKNSPK